MRFRVEDTSMEPTLKPGDYVIVNRLAYLFGKPSKNDVIVLKHPQQKEKFLVKRIAEIRDSEYFVLGDNTEFSKDSRHFGPIKRNMIVGKVWVTAKA
jgi:nickel-type superoxide dismutase maturation protease